MRNRIRIVVGALPIVFAVAAIAADGPARRAASEAAVGGVTREARDAQQLTLRAELVARMPDGALRAPIEVNLTKEDFALIAAPRESLTPLRIGLGKRLDPAFKFSPDQTAKRAVIRNGANGSFVWSLSVSSPGAQAIRVRLDDFSLPPNSELYFYSPQGVVDGPYTGTGRNGTGTFWTRSIGADTGVIQLSVQGGVDRNAISFTISEIAHISGRIRPAQPTVVLKTHDNWPCADNVACLEDANCHSGTPADPAKDAVAKLEWLTPCPPPNQTFTCVNTCTGGLLADTDGGSQIPYMLTANHCTASSISNLETWFNYTTDSCNGACPHNILTGGAPPSDTVGFTVLRTNAVGDFTLGTLDQAPPAGAVFLGWNSTPVAFNNGLSLYRISNANFGPQVYSQHDVDTGAGTCEACCGLARGDWIYAADITGATEGGSSGSPVLNGAGEVVGQLTGCCGTNCANDCAGAPQNSTIDGALAAYFDEVDDLLDPDVGCTINEDCNDSNECTTDICNAGTCENTAVADNTSCNGGSGICCGGTCTTATCSNAGDCDDSDLCTTDTCNSAGTCSASCSNTPVSCPPGESCDPADGVCKPPVCDNNNNCDPGEDCNNCPNDCRQKVNGNPNSRYCCDGDLPDCGNEACAGGGFSCDQPCSGDPECDDSDPCNGAETCVAGACVPGTPPPCQDGDGCCPSGCTEANDDDCGGPCGANKDPCTDDIDCCSLNCRNGQCKGN